MCVHHHINRTAHRITHRGDTRETFRIGGALRGVCGIFPDHGLKRCEFHGAKAGSNRAPGGIGKTCGGAGRGTAIDIGIKRHGIAQGAAEHGVNGPGCFLPRHIPKCLFQPRNHSMRDQARRRMWQQAREAIACAGVLALQRSGYARHFCGQQSLMIRKGDFANT